MQKEQNIQRVTRQLIRLFRNKEKAENTQNIDELWADVRRRVDREKAIKRRKYIISIAASAAVFLGIFLFINRNNSTGYDTPSIKEAVFAFNDIADQENIILITGEKQVTLDSGSIISYTENGQISTKSETINPKSSGTKEVEYNKLIVPRGKKIQLILPDASKLWVNSGSQVVFPRTFTKKTRDIFVDGEVYLEVAHNENAPFIVSTNKFDVQVLGTSFNICTYKEFVSSVVLVDGHVKVKDFNGKSTELEPNQLITINANGFETKKQVNASEYISWINDMLILHAEPIEDVLNKLSIYYGVSFELKEPARNLLISGKLDLKNNINDIMRVISKAIPITYIREDGKLIVDKIK